MLIPQSHLSPTLVEEHFRTYSPTLVDYPNRFLTMVSPEISFFSTSMIYVCPLCTKQYLIRHLDGILGSTEFSEDHLPPESVGGKYKVLTCKKCNNDAGSFEAELLKLLDFGSTPDKHGSLFPDVRVMNEATNESYRVAVKRTQNETNVEFRKAAKQHNPKLKAFIEKMHAGAFPKLTILVGLHDEQKLAKAILKSSYLLGFVNWGYEFVYSTYGGWIREAMLGERDYPVSAPTRLEPKLGSQARKGISIVQLNGEKIAFLMSLELSTATENVIASTFFPNPTITGWNKLVGLKSFEKSKPSVELQAITIPRTIERAGYSAAWSLIQ